MQLVTNSCNNFAQALGVTALGGADYWLKSPASTPTRPSAIIDDEITIAAIAKPLPLPVSSNFL
jgi:hypothetical protein